MRNMTAKEVSEKHNLAQSTVTKRARRLGFERSGRDWHFTEEQALAIAECDATPGPKPADPLTTASAEQKGNAI